MTTMGRESFDRDTARILAGQVLGHARQGEWDKAGSVLNDLTEIHGAEGIEVLAFGVADTLIFHQRGSHPGQPVAPLWIDDASGRVHSVDDVPLTRRWAGRFLAARAASDVDMCVALWNSGNDNQFTANVCALVELAAETLNMGRAPWGIDISNAKNKENSPIDGTAADDS